MKTIYLLPLILLMIFPLVNAEQTVKTVDIPLGHDGIINPNVVTQYNFTVDTPDGINEIISLEFTSTGDYLANTNIYGGILVGEQVVLCEPSVWTVPPWNVDNYEVSFDCSDLVQQTKWTGHPTIPLTFTFMNDNFGGNVKPRVKMTYYNYPRSSLGVFGTEYQVGENGTVFLQLFDNNKIPVNNGYCQLTIYNPDENKTKWYDQAPMTFLENGLYYEDLYLPNETGVYMLNAHCSYSDVQYKYDLPIDVGYDGSLEAGSSPYPEGVRDADCVWLRTTVAGQFHNFTFDVSGVNISTISSLDIIYFGQHQKDATVDVYNYNTSTWDNISSTYPAGAVGISCADTQAHTDVISSNIENYINGVDEVRVRVYQTSNGKMYTDKVNLIFHNNGSFIGDIRGSGEIHLSDYANDIQNN